VEKYSLQLAVLNIPLCWPESRYICVFFPSQHPFKHTANFHFW